MEINIQEAAIEQKSVLRNLLEFYIYDFTEFGPYDVDAHGLFGYKYLDHFWVEEGRHPFIFYVDGKIAGFAFVQRVFENKYNDYVYSIAEFFVMKRYRRNDIGKKVAFHIFNKFPGLWEVAQMQTNIPAQKFWRKVIREYTNGNFEEITKDNWNGPIQMFRSDLKQED